MNVLISGGAGFVGRRFVQRFLADGCHVTVVDNLVSGVAPHKWVGEFRGPSAFYKQDIREFVKENNAGVYDLFLHLAAVVGGRVKIEGDPIAVATDLAIDSDIFNWLAHARKPPKLIYFSSSAVYPVELQRRNTLCKLSEGLTNFDSTRVGMPDLTYGWSKLTGEYLAQHAAKTYGLDVVIYRPFSGYGHDQSFDYPFPSIIRRIVRKENPIVVWGSGEQTRDFFHIDDIVDAVMTTMHKLKPGETLNLGSGVGTSFLQLANRACGLLDHNVKIITDPRKPEGVFSRVADTWKLDSLYVAKRDLDYGILDCAQWLAQTLDKEPASL
jgi:nucleoside-diphosphate-sugar epimerase